MIKGFSGFDFYFSRQRCNQAKFQRIFEKFLSYLKFWWLWCESLPRLQTSTCRMPYPLANLTSAQTELRVYYLNFINSSREQKKTTQWNVGTNGPLNRFIQYWFRRDSTATCWTLVSDKWTLITGSEKKEGWAHACQMSKVILVNRKLHAKRLDYRRQYIACHTLRLT